LSVFANTVLEEPGFWGEPKTREFSPSHLLDKDAADLLNQRTVARFGRTPVEYSWTTQEKFLNFATGDVVSITTPELQGPDGLPIGVRGQITKITPKFDDFGRSYKVKALTYEAAFGDDTAPFIINANSEEINLYILVGAPSEPVEVTIVVDGVKICSTDRFIPAMKAGNFAPGSKINLVISNNGILQGKGGNGGGGETVIYEPEFPEWFRIGGSNGQDAGPVYDAESIDTDIYLGGSFNTLVALGTIRAPGGGGGGGFASITGTGLGSGHPGNGAGGGAGCSPGTGGPGGTRQNAPPNPGTDGDDGLEAGTGGAGGTSAEASDAGDGGDWGFSGGAPASGFFIPGLAGEGILKGGAVVNIFTDGNTGRFTNGTGDAPDSLT
jgi:hypothetical protein